MIPSFEELAQAYQEAVDREDVEALRAVQRQFRDLYSTATGRAHRKSDGSIWYYPERTEDKSL